MWEVLWRYLEDRNFVPVLLLGIVYAVSAVTVCNMIVAGGWFKCYSGSGPCTPRAQRVLELAVMLAPITWLFLVLRGRRYGYLGGNSSASSEHDSWGPDDHHGNTAGS
ncbi:MAG TPA: hypothetical protein VK978_03600 [Candidatus Saccharimonadales bacterium]|nr:hypothetical protein [Candidatus Saccharimonadales bacterium]